MVGGIVGQGFLPSLLSNQVVLGVSLVPRELFIMQFIELVRTIDSSNP